MEFRIKLHSRRKYLAAMKLSVVESLTCAAFVCNTQTYSQLIPCLETSCPTQALPTELWFNNPCISSGLLEQLVELQEELQRHNCGVTVPVPQLKWFMQHLVTTTSARTWLSSLNQSLKHYAESVYQSKPQNAPDSYISLQIHRFILPWEAVYHMCFGGEKLRKKHPCTAGWSISTTLVVSNHCEMLEGVCLAWMPNTTQRTTCLNKLQLCKAALEMLDEAWYGSKPIGSSVNAASM